MKDCAIAIIGGGPAGMMSAISASKYSQDIILLEKNNTLGKKLVISGKGRCNITNTGDIDNFLEHFGKSGLFLRNAFNIFFNDDLMRFFEERNLNLKIERGDRVFPIDNKSESVLNILKKELLRRKVQICYNSRVKRIKIEGNVWAIELEDNRLFKSKRLIMATGGASYPQTGSTGKGYEMVKKLGHTIIPLRPGLVPLETKESFVKRLAGLSLKNVKVTVSQGKRRIASDVGEMLFTHFGISGPLVLEMSSKISDWFENHMPIVFSIDFKPGLTLEQLENRIIRDFKAYGNRQFKNILKELLPGKLIDCFIDLSKISSNKKANQITKQERSVLVQLLKEFCLTILCTRPLSEAIITKGGVATSEINPKTVESKKFKGLYFCGEIIDIDGDTGGYNLQAAFSTGYIAGLSCGQSLN